MTSVVESSELRALKRWGFVLGPLLAVAGYLLIPGADAGGLAPGGRAAAAVGVLMAVWWLTEAMPLAVTALLPLALFPLLGVSPIRATAAAYGSDIIFLFMGGFILGLSMERWGLHRRIALSIVLAVGTGPERLVAGFLLASATLSMWISNTATAIILAPVAISVVGLMMQKADAASVGTARNFATCLVLAVAYGASIGGAGTLIGSPPNLVVASFADTQLGCDISMLEWMRFGVPAMLVMLPLTWLLLTRIAFRMPAGSMDGGRDRILAERRALGPMSSAEKRIGMVFVAAALAWMLRPQLAVWLQLPWLNDASIAIGAALLLFMLPAADGQRIMNWGHAERLPWGVLLLFGGGLSLAHGLSSQQVDLFIADGFSRLGQVPLWLLIACGTTMAIFLSELASNTAIATTFAPVMAAAALGLGIPVMPLLIALGLGASYAFMLPVGTPPNAIAFGSGHVSVAQMARAGLMLNLMGIVLITVLALSLGRGLCD